MGGCGNSDGIEFHSHILIGRRGITEPDNFNYKVYEQLKFTVRPLVFNLDMYSPSVFLIGRIFHPCLPRSPSPCFRFRTISISQLNCTGTGSLTDSPVKVTSCRHFSSTISRLISGNSVATAKPKSDNDTTSTESKAETPKKLTKSIVLNNPDQWKLIYRFKHIVAARAIQRLKLYQTGLTCFLFLPLSVMSTFLDQTQMIYTYYALGGSVLACAMLYIMGTFSSRIIGAIYVNKEDPNQINLARLTFFGSRNDTQIHAQSFIHLADMNLNPRDLYIKLQTVDNLEEDLGPLYLSMRYGDVKDLENFERVFGSMAEFTTKE